LATAANHPKTVPIHSPSGAVPEGAGQEPGLPADSSLLDPTDTFARRHIGPGEADIDAMLAELGFGSLDELADATVPASIRNEKPLALAGLSEREQGEFEILERLAGIAAENRIFRSCIGMGYSDVIIPPVIQRNVLENPGWYTQYTPYQAEISQGRLEALLNFQTAIADLTALPLAGASLLDEATAAAEAMAMCFAIGRGKKRSFYAATSCHPQTLGVVRTRAASMGIALRVGDLADIDFASQDLCGVLVQYPTTDGRIESYRELAARVHAAGAALVVAADLLALTLLEPPGEFGADITVGSAQRFGVPLGFGGPHAGYLSTHDSHARKLPGRLVGVSVDVHGDPAYRLAIQTREQHIRRDKATSNICTAQVLLAIMAGMYAVWHGPDGLRRIAKRVHAFTAALKKGLEEQRCDIGDAPFFDTLRVTPSGRSADEVLAAARERRINLRDYADGTVGVAFDETTTREDVATILEAFGGGKVASERIDALAAAADLSFPDGVRRTSDFMRHPVFHRYHSEHDMLRYLPRLEPRDLSLTT
jgi:glycine dehydrogenase